jgi:WD40 repeat protein
MFKDHKVKSNEWKGRQEHDDDITCTTVQKQQPLALATGSFDGDIVLWNSVTELPIKHLNERKRKPAKLPSIKTEVDLFY